MSKPRPPANGPGTVNPPGPSPVQPEVPPIGEPGILPRQSLGQDAEVLPEDLDPNPGLADPRDLVGAEPFDNPSDEAPEVDPLDRDPRPPVMVPP